MIADTVPRPGNLPAEPNSFVGRERDLVDLTLLLRNVRALTLCGPGGIGKTRLAVRLGWQLAPDFPDGVWLVELADQGEPAHATARVANVLGISEEPGRPVAATLADALGGRELMLILDTCEHLAAATAGLVRDLIAACPLIRIVATSREPLKVRGETVWRVPPLSLPPLSLPALSLAPPALPGSLPRGVPLPGSGLPGQVQPAVTAPAEAERAVAAAAEHEAVRLFIDRAAAVRPGFALTAGNYAAIVGLCRTLDGVPLAVELAAARIRALSVDQLATRIGDRFRLLASGDRTAPPRQRTLQATVDWSFDLLTPDEQILLRRLSVFAGFSLSMAEQVCSDDRISSEEVLGLLAALIDKSLVTLDDELAGDARYRLLDTIREYASARLAAAGEQDEIRRRHRDCLLRLMEDATGQAFVRDVLPWAEQVKVFHRVAAEQANLRAALAYCADSADAESGLRLCSALRSPWVVHGDVAEGLRWFGMFLARPGKVPAKVRARSLMLAAELAFEHQDYAQASSRAAAAVAMSTAYRGACPAGALRILALISLRAGRGEEALAQASAAVAAAREYADEWEEGLGLSAMGTVLARSGQLASAQESYSAALDLLTGNNGWGVAHTLSGLGSLARARRDNAAAIRHFTSALELFRQIGARTEMARCLAGIGWIRLASNDLPAAAASLAESLELSMASGQRLAIARGLEAFAALAAARRDDVAAVRLEGAAAAIREAVDPVKSASTQGRLDGALAPAHQRLGPARTASHLAEGKRLSMHDAAGYALSSASAGDPRPEPVNGSGPATAALQASVLTAREQQIAKLIMRGLSNRAIADELVISPATAARHVANILGKLGLSARAQVAAWTAEHESAADGPKPEVLRPGS
jgi:predicted ATPase/DNA-binding NarL/FixJ family response regulator